MRLVHAVVHGASRWIGDDLALDVAHGGDEGCKQIAGTVQAGDQYEFHRASSSAGFRCRLPAWHGCPSLVPSSHCCSDRLAGASMISGRSPPPLTSATCPARPSSPPIAPV